MYMESSHMNNTGIATFANDCVFTTPNPAQAKDSRVRNSINGFPVIMYINDELEGIYMFNLDRYSTNSLGYDTKTFPKCLSYEISANTDTGAGAFVPWSTESGKTEREYIASDFRCRFPENRVNGDDDFAELKRLVNWVGNATDDMFREQIEEYFDLTYLIRYYLTVMCFGLVDNLAKNTMLTTFDGNKWYMQLYDCDSSTGLDNSGAMKFEPDIEVQVGVFNTSNSRLWTKLRNNFPNQILAEWETLRLSFFTEENIMKYINENISDKIPEINYNLDAWKKYITMGTEFLFACHGNRKQQFKRWIRERLIYMDTLLGYTVSTNDYITVRANKLGEVYFDIQTFQPMYFSIKFRNEENNTGVITKRVARGETVRFSYNLPVATDQEILVYGGRFIKDLGDLTNMNPTNLLLGNATRLTKVVCHDSDMLINASISNCTMLQEVDLRGCRNLGAGSDASLQTLDLTQCRNLRKVDIFGTQLTALYTSTVGGIIQEIVYPYSIQIVQVKNQTRLTSLGIPCYYTGNVRDENNRYAEMLTLVDVANCPNVTSFVKNYYTNEDGSEVQVPTFIGVSKCRTFNISNTMSYLTRIDLSHCSNIESLTLDNFYDLKEINFDDISLWNATSSNLSNLTLKNCPNIETITFNQNTIDGDNSLGVAFKEGTTLDLSGLFNLKYIRSNVGIKGLQKLILPSSIVSLVFDYPEDTTYSYGDSDIIDIFSKTASHDTDNYHGIDLIDINGITDFSIGSLTKINDAINLNIKITNTFPYFNYFKNDDYFKPEGTIDISDYTETLQYLFKGVDLDKLNIVCNKPLSHTSAKYMFAFASCNNVEILNTLFSYMPNVTDFSYMFYNGHLTKAPLIPLRAENVSYMFYNNLNMIETPSNWNQPYSITPNSQYCYTGCANIALIDGEYGNIDIIPAMWGGFDRVNITVTGETITVDKTMERELVKFTATGKTFQNIVPEVGQTPTILANKSEQSICEGMENNIMIANGTMPQAELKGYTLVNLASEKRSGELNCNKQVNNIRNGLIDAFKIDDGKAFNQAILEGLSLTNVMPENGFTPIITNNGKQSHRIDDNLDSNIKIKNGKMLATTVYGKTLKNIADNTSPLYTNNHQEITKILNDDSSIKIKDTCKFKSAILKGQTLVNLVKKEYYGSTQNGTSSTDSDYVTVTEANEVANVLMNLTPSQPLEANTLYTLVILDKGLAPSIIVRDRTNAVNLLKTENSNTLTFTTTDKPCDSLTLYYTYVSVGQKYKHSNNVMIFKGDVSNLTFKNHFTGMQSVKMPVLKATGKNQTYHILGGDINSNKYNLMNLIDEHYNTNNKLNVAKVIKWVDNETFHIKGYGIDQYDNQYNIYLKPSLLKPNQKYRVSFKEISGAHERNDNLLTLSRFCIYINGEKFLTAYENNTIATFTTPNDITSLHFNLWLSGKKNKSDVIYAIFKEFMIEELKNEQYPVSYEPYKSNILYCNEEVTLHSVGDVCDTLDCKTGELTKYTIFMDDLGNYDMPSFAIHDGTYDPAVPVLKISFKLPKTLVDTGWDATSNFPLICDKIKVSGDGNGYSESRGSYISTKNGELFLHLIKKEMGLPTDVWINKSVVQDYFKSNPIKVVCKLREPITETIDLNVDYKEGNKKYIFRTHEDVTHVSVSSEGLAPITEVGYITNDDNVETVTLENKFTILENAKENTSIQSAILKGQTLVNLAKYELSTYYQDLLCHQNASLYKNNTTYTLFNFTDKTIIFNTYTNSTWRGFEWLGANSKRLLTINDFILAEVLGRSADGWDKTTETEKFLNGYMIIEGDYINVDVPFFKDMQSVKMPVLKTCGKNLFNCTNVENINNSYTVVNMNNQNYIMTDTLVEKGKQYTLSLHANISGATGNILSLGYMNYSNIVVGVERASHNILTIDSVVDKTISTTFTAQTTDYIKIYIATEKMGYNVVLSNVQIEEGIAETTYEPYKSNTLTVNEPIELRGVGNVQDTLDLMTGEVTQRIGEIVLNGSEDWWFANSSDNPENPNEWSHSKNTWLLGVDFKTISSNTRPVKNTISDKYPVYYDYGFSDSEYFNILNNNHSLLFRVRKDRFSDKSIVNFKSWLSQNPITIQYKLTTDSIKTVDLSIKQTTELTCFNNGYLSISSDELIPNLEYRVVSDNYFDISNLMTNKTYTLRYNGTPTTMTICGNTMTPTNNMIINLSNVNNNILTMDEEVLDLMLIEGDVRNEEIKYFKNIASVKALEIIIDDMIKQNSISMPPHISLYSLPDGTKDELDIKTGILTRKIDINDDETLYKLDVPTQEKLILNYNHSCEYGMVLPTGAMDYYNVVTSEYSQNILSIELKGEREWDEIVENTNTVRVLYISTTDIKMKASGGLYCDNNMFPNIQDDSDVEHCRVHDTDNNKLYIYINKDKLMSPDLVGFQIWLQENPFTVYYETSETIISTKNYNELNPELARWEMMDCRVDSNITYSGIVYPEIYYIALSANRFEVNCLEQNTVYTVYAENMIENPTINLGGKSYNFVSGNIYTSGNNNIVIFNDNPSVSNIMLIKGDTRDEVVPYFKGRLNVVNPTVAITNDTNTSSATINVILRSTINGIKDSYNILTGEYIKRVSEDLQELSSPIITTLEPQTLLAYENSKILLSSESGLLPTLNYSVPSTNTFRLPIIKTRTQYTLKYPSASGKIFIGNLSYNINSDSMVFTTPLTINGDKTTIVFSDDNPQDVMLIEGNYSKREIPFFTGVKSVTNPKITVLNNSTGESVLYECGQNVNLRSLPNGVSDTFDIVNNKLTQVTGERQFKDGDYELDNVWTDGNYTVYGLSSPIVSTIEFETPSVYNDSTIYLSSDYMIPVLKYRALSSNNFPLDLLLPNTTYTLYANTLVSGSYTLGGIHSGVFTGTEVINLGDITNNLLTFNGDLGLSNVMLIKGNSINSTLPFFRGLKSVLNHKLIIRGMNDELNELIVDDGIGLRACGDLVDTIDLMTCTLTRNLSELTLNGSELWNDITTSENVDSNYCLFSLTVAGVKSSSSVNLACDRLNHYYLKNSLHDKESIYTETNQIRICIKKTTIGGDNVNALKSWLQQNNITLVYALQNSVIIPLENQWTTMPPTSYSNQTTIDSEVVDSLKPTITITVATTTLEQIVSDLQTENLITMMALTEMYETLPTSNTSVATTLSLRSDRMIVVTPMATIYAKLIKKGLKSIDEVPESLVEQVKYLLRY